MLTAETPPRESRGEIGHAAHLRQTGFGLELESQSLVFDVCYCLLLARVENGLGRLPDSLVIAVTYEAELF